MVNVISAAPTGIGPIDPTLGGIIVAVLGLIGGIYTARGAYLRSKAAAAAEAETAVGVHALAVFEQSKELSEFIDTQLEAKLQPAIDKATEPLKRDIQELKEQIGRVHDKLSRTRQAAREYIRAVFHSWGRQEQPPVITDHLRSLLADDDLEGTFTRAELNDRLEDENVARASRPNTASAAPSATLPAEDDFIGGVARGHPS